jgi:hypothetical protein
MDVPTPRQPAAGSANPLPPDPADDVNFPVPGWPSLANLISENRALEAFPSFADLSIKSLLYYQAELVYLRKALHKIEYRGYYHPSNNGDPSHFFAGNISELHRVRHQAILANKDCSEQWILIEKIRATLDKYCELFSDLAKKVLARVNSNLKDNALLQFSTVLDFPHADSLDVNVLKHCVRSISNGSSIVGDGISTWGSTFPTAEREKSLLSLFFGLFVSPDLGREHVPNEFQEQLILPRPGKTHLID